MVMFSIYLLILLLLDQIYFKQVVSIDESWNKIIILTIYYIL